MAHPNHWRPTTRTLRVDLAWLRRRAPAGTGIGEGRWSLLPLEEEEVAEESTAPRNEELAEDVAWQLLARWGVVAFEVWARESFRVPWREVVWALRRLEARGVALGGRFVMGLSGEQYALPEAAQELQKVSRTAAGGEEVVVAGADPLNVTGSVVGGARIPTRRNQRVTLRDGAVVENRQAG